MGKSKPKKKNGDTLDTIYRTSKAITAFLESLLAATLFIWELYKWFKTL